MDDGIREIHREALVVDTHCDTLKCLMPMFTLPRNSQWDDRSDIGMGVRSALGRARGENHLKMMKEVLG